MSTPDQNEAVKRLLEVADIAFPPDPEKMSGEFAEFWQMANAEVGYICAAWARMERALAILLASLLKSKIAYADVILGTLTANKVKRDLVLNVARLGLARDGDLHRVQAALRRMAKAAGKRNFLVHAEGVFHTKYPYRLTFIGVSADLDPALAHYEAWGIGDLRDLRRTLENLAADISELAESLRTARRRPLRETRLPGPDGGLAVTNNRRPPAPSESPTPQKSSHPSRPKKLSSAQKRALRQKGVPS